MIERAIRLYVEPPLETGADRVLAPAQAHYLARVMRCRTGDRIRVFDGVSGEWTAALAVGRRDVTLTVEALGRPQVVASGPVLALPPIRRQRLEWAVEKACELGVAAIRLVLTERTGEERVKLERLRAIAIEAAEQSERLTVPDVDPPVPLGDWLAAREPGRVLYQALERSDALPLTEAVARHGSGDLVVGPEGGFAPADRTLLEATPSGVAVGLGPTILRVETAALAGLAVLALAAPHRAS